MMWGMGGTGSEVHEEWFIWRCCFLLTNPANCFFSDSFREMPVRIVMWHFNGCCIFKKWSEPLIRFPALESVEVIKTFTCWPAFVRATCSQFMVRRIVPFA